MGFASGVAARAELFQYMPLGTKPKPANPCLLLFAVCMDLSQINTAQSCWAAVIAQHSLSSEPHTRWCAIQMSGATSRGRHGARGAALQQCLEGAALQRQS